MIKLSVVIVALLTSISSFAWDDSRKDNGKYVNQRNEPKSYTLSGDDYRRNRSDDSGYNARKSDRDSQGSSNGAYRSGNQINNNGLIINTD